MRKNQFENYNKEISYCNKCKKYYPTSLFSPSKLSLDGVGTCKICNWIKIHNGIPLCEGVTQEQMHYILCQLFMNDTTVINDLSNYLHLDLITIIKAIHKSNIGNKKIVIKCKCECCGKEIVSNPQRYLDNNYMYCSFDNSIPKPTM